MRKTIAFVLLCLLLSACRSNRGAVVSQPISDSNAELLTRLELAEEKMEDSKQAYVEALASLEHDVEQAYISGLYDGCMANYLIRTDNEVFSLSSVELEALLENSDPICREALALADRFQESQKGDGSFFGLPPND